MPRNFEIGPLKWKRGAIRDPRIAMRIVIGVLLAANLAAAVIAFHPFGGADPREEQAALGQQLAGLEKRVAANRRLVNNVETARKDGDKFVQQYITESRAFASTIREELARVVKESGVKPLASQVGDPELIEGSNSVYQVRITAGFEGSYASLKKVVEFLDKSPRFLILETMSVTSPQQQSGQVVSFNLVLDTFERAAAGAEL